MSKNIDQIWIHCVWATKYREPTLHKKWRIDLFMHIRKQGQLKGFRIDYINGIEDHVHVLIKMKPTQNVSQIIKNIKGESSRWINDNELLENGKNFYWQNGYAVFSVDKSRVEMLRKYIKNQETHHRKNKSINELG